MGQNNDVLWISNIGNETGTPINVNEFIKQNILDLKYFGSVTKGNSSGILVKHMMNSGIFNMVLDYTYSYMISIVPIINGEEVIISSYSSIINRKNVVVSMSDEAKWTGFSTGYNINVEDFTGSFYIEYDAFYESIHLVVDIVPNSTIHDFKLRVTLDDEIMINDLTCDDSLKNHTRFSMRLC